MLLKLPWPAVKSSKLSLVQAISSYPRLLIYYGSSPPPFHSAHRLYSTQYKHIHAWLIRIDVIGMKAKGGKVTSLPSLVMASGWVKSLQCKTRAVDDVVESHQLHLLPASSSCRKSFQSLDQRRCRDC